ncbi:alpha/beta fold hydrolase [Streptomyces sp. NPDC006475]|uniref:alpha/beta fold hydrolase n=1 Tax=Streptomyces sp. NPDC006475 TaxID=3155719 RepID=UPI0033BD16D8
MTNKQSTWTGMVPVEDTALAVTDTGGPGRPVVYLNGSYASKRHWRPVIAELGSDWRHITYDERARGKSKRSKDYSFEACVRDLDAVLKARGLDRPLLVGWSYGALLGVYWAARNPDRVAGVVGIDGPYPFGWTDEADLERVRQLFRRMRLVLPLVSCLGLSARFSANQHAEINIEAHKLHADIKPVYDRVTCPVRIVEATGASMGAGAEEFAQMRASLAPVLEAHPNVQIGVKGTGNHQTILKKDFRAIATVVREIATADNHRAS